MILTLVTYLLIFSLGRDSYRDRERAQQVLQRHASVCVEDLELCQYVYEQNHGKPKQAIDVEQTHKLDPKQLIELRRQALQIDDEAILGEYKMLTPGDEDVNP